MGQAPRDDIEQMLTNIVGLSIPIHEVIGRFTMSAHHSDAGRLGAADGVRREQHGRATAQLADEMAAGSTTTRRNHYLPGW